MSKYTNYGRTEDSKVKKFLLGILSFIVSLMGTLIGGLTLSISWNWYIAPKFHLPELRVIDSIGIFITIGVIALAPVMSLTFSKNPRIENSENKSLIKNSLIILGYFIILFAAWCWHFAL